VRPKRGFEESSKSFEELSRIDMEEVTEHAVGAGVEGMLEVLAGRRTESKPTMGLDIMEKVKPVVSEKSALVGASNKSPSDPKTTDIFEGAHEELINPEAQPLREVLGEGFAQGSELSSRLESVYMTANVEFDLEKISTLLQHVPVNPKSVQGDRSILSISPFSSPADLNQELITEVFSAVEEMTSVASIGGRVLPGESQAILVPSHLRIDPSDIIEVRKIGRGTSAKVYEVIWSSCRCAVKRFKSEYSSELVSVVQKELDFLIEFRHPHIVMLMGLSVDSQQRCSIVMELMSGSLHALIESRMQERRSIETKQKHSSTPIVPFTPSEALEVITKIARGMWYLHSKGVSHRDLKSDNVMVRDLGQGFFEVKIVDFGASLNLDNLDSSGMRIGVGTGFWRAPEILPSKTADRLSKPDLKAADVYSFAMTCYEVLTGQLPFQGQLRPKEYGKVIAGLRPKLPKELNSRLKGLIESCWHNDPNMRPVFENICVVLNNIRSSMSAVTNKSSGIGKVWNPFRQFPAVQGILNEWLGGVQDRAELVEPSPSQPTISAGNMGNGSGSPELVAFADAIKIPECLKIRPATLKRVRKIGSGSTSKVYEATWLGCTCAVKRIKKIENPKLISALQQELDFLIQLRHPYIIQLVGFSIDEQERCSIVMEYMNGSLRDLINSRRKKKATASRTHSSQPVVLFEFHEAVGIITKLAQGMAFLHSRRVTHRDLKALNVLCQEHAGSIDVKIVDFGVSQYIAAASGVNTVLGVGTGFWRAPEIFPTGANRARESSVNLMAADVYSFAMTCYEILTGEVPFEEYGFTRTQYDEVVKGLRPTLPPHLDAGLKELLVQCWHDDPVQRPNFAEICTRINTLAHC
jgi:serine/threonine protein kinase